MRKFERLARQHGWAPGGKKKPTIDALSHLFCLNASTIHHLLLSLEISETCKISGNGKDGEAIHPTLIVEAASAPNPKAIVEKAIAEEWTAAKVRQEVKRQKKAARARNVELPPKDERYRIECCDFKKAKVEPETVDWVITDPPYPKEFLSEYKALSEFSERVLKPGGSLICMSGQSYLPEVIGLLSTKLTYHWTLAYLTPGAATQLYARKVNTSWKPLLWFVKGQYKGEWIQDVCKSPKPDKNHHEWGQSEGGMTDIVERFTQPGDWICDPFLGAGTTGVAALSTKRLFIGFDIDEDSVITANERFSCLAR